MSQETAEPKDGVLLNADQTSDSAKNKQSSEREEEHKTMVDLNEHNGERSTSTEERDPQGAASSTGNPSPTGVSTNAEENIDSPHSNGTSANISDEVDLSVSQQSSSHSEQYRRFTCNICGQSFTKQISMTLHRRLHTGENTFTEQGLQDVGETYPCTVCGKAFKNHSNFLIHERLHKMQKIPRNFAVKRVAKRELPPTHAGKTLSCGVCGRTFKHQHSLRFHLRLHMEKAFICTMCGSRFSEVGDLEKHRRTHKDWKPWSCITCGKTFKQSRALETHQLGHSQQELSCGICWKTFTRREDFLRHESVHEGSNALTRTSPRKTRRLEDSKQVKTLGEPKHAPNYQVLHKKVETLMLYYFS